MSCVHVAHTGMCSIHICIFCVWMCMHRSQCCGGHKTTMNCSIALHLVSSETGSVHWTWRSLYQLEWMVVSFRDSPVSTPLHWGSWCAEPCLAFYVTTGFLNLGPYGYPVSTLSMEPSPQPSQSYLNPHFKEQEIRTQKNLVTAEDRTKIWGLYFSK